MTTTPGRPDRTFDPVGYPHVWAFLGDALRSPRQAFDRARNVSYWGPACVLLAVGVLLGHLADPFETMPLAVGVALVTGGGLLVFLLMTAVARAVCGGYGAGVGATASQAALLAGVLNIPGEALALALGADAVLVTVVGAIAAAVSVCYLTVLFSVAFEVGNGRAFAGVLLGSLALLVLLGGLVGCLGILAGTVPSGG
jgi:hypothetical protein